MMRPRNREIKKNILSIVALIPLIFLASFSPDLTVFPHKTTVLTDKTIWFPGSIIKSDAVTGDIQSVIIPIKRVGKLFLIEARIDNETGNFIFDYKYLFALTLYPRADVLEQIDERTGTAIHDRHLRGV